jgi:hypothetical protein
MNQPPLNRLSTFWYTRGKFLYKIDYMYMYTGIVDPLGNAEVFRLILWARSVKISFQSPKQAIKNQTGIQDAQQTLQQTF